MAKKNDRKAVKSFAGFIDIPFYPINYAKVLIQIGHEPLPPFKSTSLFGTEQLYYPNLFSYLRYIHSVEGFTGLYRGLGMRIISNIVGNHVQGITYQAIEDYEREERFKNPKPIDISNWARFVNTTSKEITSKCAAIIISHPFHVMTLRCMAQFIGGETKYSSWNFVQNSIVIYKGEGLKGFFSGLIPRILFEASTIALTNLLVYLIKTYLFDESEMAVLVDTFSGMLASSITYPLSLTSTVAAVAGSGLVAGQPPRMIYYTSWVNVFQDLYDTNQLKRGSSMFFRTCFQPSVPSFKVGPVVPAVAPALAKKQKL